MFIAPGKWLSSNFLRDRMLTRCAPASIRRTASARSIAFGISELRGSWKDLVLVEAKQGLLVVADLVHEDVVKARVSELLDPR